MFTLHTLHRLMCAHTSECKFSVRIGWISVSVRQINYRASAANQPVLFKFSIERVRSR
ncbi:Orf86 [Heliothis zea nudivirus]|uniref:Orf86 n=1 Tax=Heliothis zea nudivirus 1 TaxID=3116536 RepID=Q8JKM7_9VIRU|nr:Orf86 [Heliothis zea nudivirus]AAN04380.1 Orf86 [Heliothis zea nudivirus]